MYISTFSDFTRKLCISEIKITMKKILMKEVLM